MNNNRSNRLQLIALAISSCGMPEQNPYPVYIGEANEEQVRNLSLPFKLASSIQFENDSQSEREYLTLVYDCEGNDGLYWLTEDQVQIMDKIQSEY